MGGDQGVQKRSSTGEKLTFMISPMDTITVPSSLIAPHADGDLTPAMVSAIWEIAAVLDEKRIKPEDGVAIWLSLPTKRLRGSFGRSDNHWLRQCLDRLSGVKFSGEYRGDHWGAILVAEWRIYEGGSMATILIPPAGVMALRSPETFAKIESEAAHRLRGPARRLYGILADKKRLGRPSWTFSLDELRILLAVHDCPSYDRWQAFKRWVLGPAVSDINEFGTVDLKMTPVKEGRSVCAVRFDWRWKEPRAATELIEENARHSKARRKQQKADDAPPMIEVVPQREPALTWWGQLKDREREAWTFRVGATFQAAGQTFQRREADIARSAFQLHEDGIAIT